MPCKALFTTNVSRLSLFIGHLWRLLIPFSDCWVDESNNIIIELITQKKQFHGLTKNPIQESMKNNFHVQWLTLVASLCFVVGSAHAQQPPATDRVLWLKADAGTTLGTNFTVQKWADQAGGVLNDAVPYSVAAPRLGEVNFSNGPQPVILFNGQG